MQFSFADFSGFLHMSMRKQMVLTIFLIAGTLTAITELQFRIGKFRSSADHALMLRDSRSRTRL